MTKKLVPKPNNNNSIISLYTSVSNVFDKIQKFLKRLCGLNFVLGTLAKF